MRVYLLPRRIALQDPLTVTWQRSAGAALRRRGLYRRLRKTKRRPIAGMSDTIFGPRRWTVSRIRYLHGQARISALSTNWLTDSGRSKRTNSWRPIIRLRWQRAVERQFP